MKVIFVRHGQTDWNKKKKIQGQTNTTLNDDGKKESLAIRYALEKDDISLIFSSPLERAYKTVEPLATKKKKPIICAKYLIERGFGVVEGLEIENIKSRKEKEQSMVLRKTGIQDYRPEGGESLVDVHFRVIEFLSFLLNINLNGVVVCMTHGGVLDILYRVIMREPLSSKRNWMIPNGAFYVLERCNQDFQIVNWAEISHLNRYEILDEY